MHFAGLARCWGRKRRMHDQRMARRVSVPIAVALLVVVTSTGCPAQERPVSPALGDAAGSQPGQSSNSDKAARTVEENELSEWLTLPSTSDRAYWSSFDSATAGNVRAGATFDRRSTSPSGTAPAPDQLRVGKSYLEIQTRKNVQVLQSLRSTDCADDDECAEYSGLPKSEQRKTSARNFKRPFIGLSITRPLQ